MLFYVIKGIPRLLMRKVCKTVVELHIVCMLHVCMLHVYFLLNFFLFSSFLVEGPFIYFSFVLTGFSFILSLP